MDLTAAIEAKRNKQKKPDVVAEEPIEMTPQNMEDLEKQLDEALEEFKKEEILIEELECEDMQVSNNQIYKSIVEVNETLVIGKREELIITNKVFRAIEKLGVKIDEEVTPKLTKMDKKLNKKLLLFLVVITALMFFGLGFITSSYKEELSPVMGKLLGVTVEQATRHAVGGND